jgi:hypothetical protein
VKECGVVDEEYGAGEADGNAVLKGDGGGPLSLSGGYALAREQQ